MEGRIENSMFSGLEDVKIEFDNNQSHEVYFESHIFFAFIQNGTSLMVQFIPMIKDEHAFPTFIDGARVRIDGEMYIVLDHRQGTLPVMEYGHEPPFDPIFMLVYVHRLYPISDVDDPFPDTVWTDVPGMTHKIPDNDPQLQQVAHGRAIAKLLKTNVESINALIKEGSSNSDLEEEIADVREFIEYNMEVMLKNVTREHIRGIYYAPTTR